MSTERWTELGETLVDLKIIDRAKLNIPAAFSADFLK
jgi:hypothetical protein